MFFVNLAPIADPQFVVGAIAQALDVRAQANRPLLEQSLAIFQRIGAPIGIESADVQIT